MCDKNPQKIKAIFENISLYYDKMNDIISFCTHKLIKKSAINELEIKPYTMVLDLCCGTGDFSGIITKNCKDVKVIGLDVSPNMLKIAKQKYPQMTFMEGDCTDLPFNEDFEYITMGFGLRNIENRQKALEQIYKSLKSGGKFLHLDFGKHNKISKIFDKIVPYLVKLSKKDLTNYEYLLQSKNTYPEPDELIEEFENAGLKFVRKKDFLFGAISCQVMKKP